MSVRQNVDRVISEVLTECKRHLTKWGVQNHDPDYWLGIEGEEFGEACEALEAGDLDAYRTELIQVAAVAVSAIECLDRVGPLEVSKVPPLVQIGSVYGRLCKAAIEFDGDGYRDGLARLVGTVAIASGQFAEQGEVEGMGVDFEDGRESCAE